jgi:hypothetical protein
MTPPGWPAGVNPVSLETIERLGVNDEGALFWDGKPVEVRNTLDLSLLQRIGAAIVVLATVLGGVGGLAQGITATVDFACARGAWPHLCAPPPKGGTTAAHTP